LDIQKAIVFSISFSPYCLLLSRIEMALDLVLGFDSSSSSSSSSSEDEDGAGGGDADYKGPFERLTRAHLQDHEYRIKFRMDKATFRRLYDKIGAYFPAPRKKTNRPIYPETAIMASLQFLASGSFQNATGSTVHISQPSMSRILLRFCNAVRATMIEELSWYETQREAQNAQAEFFRASGISGVLGIIGLFCSCHSQL
jgi:hypothetical protein